MAITRPDIYQHTNPDNAIVDSTFVRGGGRKVADLPSLYTLSGKTDQLSQNITKVWVTSENKNYVLTDINNVGNISGWTIDTVDLSGLGDVTGATSSTNNNVVVFNGATGKQIKDLNINGIYLTGLTANVHEQLSNLGSTGVYIYSGATVSSPTTFDISLAKGWIVQNGYEFSESPLVTKITYSGETGLTTPYLNTNDATYILLTSGSTITLQPTFPTPIERRNNIFLGKINHPNRTTILNINNIVDYELSPMSALRDMFSSFKYINDGITISSNGNNLNFNLSTGSLYGMGINWVNNQLDPNKIIISSATPKSFLYRTQTGGTSTSVTDIDPNSYDLNGVITTIVDNSNKKSTNQRVYLYPTGVINIQYGQQIYDTLAIALAAQQTEPFIKSPNVASTAILIGLISVRKGATNLSDPNDAVFVPASIFGESVGGVNGISTTSLQQAYNNSGVPQIVTNSTLDGVEIQIGSASNLDKALKVKNITGDITASIDGNGYYYGNGSLLSGVTPSVMTNAGDIIIGGSNGTPTRLGLGGQNTVLHGGTNNPTYSAVVEDDMTLSDNSTNDATILRHGFLPKLSNNASQFLNGQGNFTTPAGTVNSYSVTSFSLQTGVTVTHSFGTYPVVAIIDNSGAVIIPYSITHNSLNDFTVIFSQSSTGNIISSVGSPQASSVVITSNDYIAVGNDKHIKVTAAGKFVTLLTATGRSGFELYIDNASSGILTVNTTSSQTIHGQLTQTVPPNSTLAVYSDGSNWRIF